MLRAREAIIGCVCLSNQQQQLDIIVVISISTPPREREKFSKDSINQIIKFAFFAVQ